MTVTLIGLYAILVLGAALAEPTGVRRTAFLGLVPYALGAASYEVALGTGDVRRIGLAAGRPADSFFVIDTGMLLLGVAVCGAAGLVALRRRPRVRAVGPLVGSLVVLGGLVPLIGPSGEWRPVVAAAAAAGIAGLGGALAVRFLRAPSDQGAVSVVRWPGANRSPTLAIGFAISGLGVVAGPNVSVVFAGLGAAAVIDFLDRRGRTEARVPWLVLATLALAPAWWLLNTIAGPVGLGLATLADIPLSPSAETLLALPVAVVAWACLGLWPGHRLFPGGLLAPLGVGLWLRIGSPALGDGLAHWQPALVPLGVLGLWGAAASGTPARALNALAFIVLASEAPESAAVALVLAGAALAFQLGRRPGEARLAARVAWTAAAAALPFAFVAGFRAQVTYTLAAAGGTALACWLGFSGSAAREAAPSEIRP